MSISAIQGFEIPRNSVKSIENILKMFQISLEKTNREMFLTQTGFRIINKYAFSQRLHVANAAIDVFGFIPHGQILKTVV